jgi:iron complex outermembrane receptor protein
MKIILLFSVYLLTCTQLYAQQKVRTQLTGKVTDAKTGQPLAGASIVLSDSHAGTITDSNGVYVFKNLPVGHTIFEVSYAGYKTLVAHLDIKDNSEHDFALTTSMLENEGVTVTAVGSATSIRKTPIPISRVSKSELLGTTSTNIIDALTRQPGINQLSTGPAISKPVIRGLGYNRLIVINDGVRQEGQQWGDEHGIEIDENSVSRIEIVKGPASLIYGSDAIAGVINIITTAPVPSNTLKANFLTSYLTNNKQRSFFGNMAGNENGFNWSAWADYKAAADYKNKYDGRVFNSKFNEMNFGGYLGVNRSWGFTHFIASRFNQTVGLIEGERDANGNFVKQLPAGMTGLPTESDFNSVDPEVPYQDIHHVKFISDNSFKVGVGRITVNLGWQRNQRQEFGNPDAPDVNDLFFDLKTFNYNAIYHFSEKNHGWTSSIGVNGMQQNNANRGPEVLIPEYALFDIGAFIYTSKSIGSTTLSGGVRYDHRALDSKEYMQGNVMKFESFTRQFSNFSSSAGISYTPKDNFVLKFNLAQGFRAPSVPELSSNGAHEGTNRYEYGDVDLKSEKSFQADLGMEINSQHILATANVFYNHINNFIFYRKLTSASGADSLVNVNGDLIPSYKFDQHNASLAGAEFLVDLHPHPLDWLHWQNTLSYVRGVFSDPIEGDKDIPFIPATRWISELRTELFAKGKTVNKLALHFEVDHTFSQDHPFTSYGTETATASYTLLNAAISANINSKNKTLFSIYLNSMNLGDVAYQTHLSRLKYTDENQATGRMGVFNMGRNFSIKVNVPLSFNTK